MKKYYAFMLTGLCLFAFILFVNGNGISAEQAKNKAVTSKEVGKKPIIKENVGTIKIVKGTFHAAPDKYRGKCPKEIKFEGSITVEGVKSPVVIKYHFVRSDGAVDTANHEIKVSKDGTYHVTDTWTLGAAGEKTSGWEKLVIDSPVKYEVASKAAFRMECSKR